MESAKNQPAGEKAGENRHILAFKEEALERLAELEDALLELENNPSDQELLDSAFRAMHTIKGSAGMFGFEDIVDFTHNIETVFDCIRDGSIEITKELIALGLQAHDQIGKLLNEADGPLPEDQETRNGITEAFLNLLPTPQDSVIIEESKPNEKVKPAKQELSIYRIRFKPGPGIFATGTNPLLILNELKELGECRVIAHAGNITELEQLDPESCYTWWDIILSTRELKNEIEDVFIFMDDSCDVQIDLIDTNSGFDFETGYKKLGEILIERGDIEQEELQKVIENKVLLGEQLQNEGLLQPSQVESALEEQKVVRETREKRRKKDSVSSIRVTSTKLDKLVDLVGELVTAQARLSQIAAEKEDSTVLSIAEEIERLTAELRDSTMSVRMLTFGTTFNKFKRLVRDLSTELEKDIILVTNGEETELDKNVIEQLNDPLVHLLRNAADHGIESPQERIATGKPSQGTIELSASYSGAQVLIKIVDDGSGMDPANIRQKAIDKGLITKESKLSDKDCLFLIFEPGFSTAKEVSNVSGRGVGMDVVKKAIENLRGAVDIDSHIGVGTTITVKLPLTLAIIDGLLVQVHDEYYVIPLAFVEECIELTAQDIKNSHGRHVTNVRGQLVPYVRLREQFNICKERLPIEQVVITEIEGHRVGFVVDKVVGQHQTVIKKLSRVYKDIDTISGATIMADGTVALIIDINKHLQLAEKEYNAQYGNKVDALH